MSQYNALVYMEQGSAQQVVDNGGTIRVLSGGQIIFESGATFQVDGVTAGTASASLPMVPDSSNNISGLNTLGVKFLNFAAAGIVNLDSETKTCSSNACTSNKQACVVTTEALTTAAGSSQAIAITNSQAAAGDIAMVTLCGGTNTNLALTVSAVCTSTTITVTLTNVAASDALNGTVKFNVILFKA